MQRAPSYTPHLEIAEPTNIPTESRADVQESLSNNEEKHAEEKHAALSPAHPKQLPTNPYARRCESATRDYPDEISMSTQELDLNVSRLVRETNDGVPHSLTMRELKFVIDVGSVWNKICATSR